MNFGVSQSPKESYDKKSDIRDFNKELNSNHFSLQHKIIFIDFSHVNLLFIRSNKEF